MAITARYPQQDRQRGGTTRRDSRGRRVPGEFNERDEPMGSQPENRPMGKTPTPQWQTMFPPVETQRSAEQMTSDGAATTKRVQDTAAMPPSPMPGGALWGIGATGAAMAAQAVDSQKAAGNASMPQVGATRRTATGGTETLTDSQSGARWVASVANAPGMNNVQPGQSATASLADRATVSYANAPGVAKDKNGMPVGQVPAASEYLKHYQGDMGKVTESTTANWWDAPRNSAQIQGMLNDGVSGAPAARTAIASNAGQPGQGMTPFGPVSVGFPQSGQPSQATAQPKWATSSASMVGSPADSPSRGNLITRPQPVAGAQPSPVAAAPTPQPAPQRPAGPLAGGVPLAGLTLPKLGSALVQGATAPQQKITPAPVTPEAARANRAKPVPMAVDLRKAPGALWDMNPLGRVVNQTRAAMPGVIDTAAKVANSGSGQGSPAATWLEEMRKRRLTPQPSTSGRGGNGSTAMTKFQLGQ